jgi:Lrp/AsnC family transcriptional regulator
MRASGLNKVGSSHHAKESYDALDLRILAVVQADASLPIGEIAQQVHLSNNACWRRLKRLEEEGFIRRRVALLDADRLGAGVTVFVSIRVAEHSDDWLAKFAGVIAQIPEIVELYRMSGDVDYLMKLKVSDIASYDAVYKRLIRSVQLSDVSSAFAMEEIKQTTSIPLPKL